LSTDFAALGIRPIPGNNPAGADARYEPEYAVVLAEIEKLSFSGQGETASWPLIQEKAVAILTDKSKDIQIAAYLAVALLHNSGLAGLLDGVRLLSALLGNFWEQAWPPLTRMRGRVNALGWWQEHVKTFLQEQVDQNAAVSATLQKNILDSLAALDKTLGSRLPDAVPVRSLTEIVKRLSAPPSGGQAPPQGGARPAAPPSNARTGAAPSSVPGGAGGAGEATDPAAPQDITVLLHRFVEAGRVYLAAARRADPANATLWRFFRLLLWSSLTALPQAENRQTLLPPPDQQDLVRARKQLEAGKALDAAFAAEEFFALSPLCLDAQAFIFTALSVLGPQFAEAAQAVREESARLIARLPGLEKLSFADGSPYATPATIAWLQGALSSLRPGPEEKGTSGASGTPSPSRRLEEARALLAQNRLPEALDMLDAAKKDSASENLNFRIAQLCLLCDAGKSETALALAEALLQESTARDLDNWDPHLALDTLTAVRNALELFDAGNAPARREVTRRLARLRPSSILG
jgi:type VI secretion system protein VasJ